MEGKGGREWGGGGVLSLSVKCARSRTHAEFVGVVHASLTAVIEFLFVVGGRMTRWMTSLTTLQAGLTGLSLAGCEDCCA